MKPTVWTLLQVALDRVRVLSEQVISTQDELSRARQEIFELRNNLLMAERDSLEKDRVAIQDISLHLKGLLEANR
jgi:hypothetical protein